MVKLFPINTLPASDASLPTKRRLFKDASPIVIVLLRKYASPETATFLPNDASLPTERLLLKLTSPDTPNLLPKDTSLDTNNRLLMEASPTMFTLLLKVPLLPVKTEPPIVIAFAFKNKRPFSDKSPDKATLPPKDASLPTKSLLFNDKSPTVVIAFAIVFPVILIEPDKSS